MPTVQPHYPEPLRSFANLESTLAEPLARLDVLLDQFQRSQSAGKIPPNTWEAMRTGMTYHSNAIEGSTLSLRETQLVLEGRSPGAEHPMRELYEARNHHRALRMIEQWTTERGVNVPISERDVLDVHARVLADIDDLNAGRFRSTRVLIAGTGYVPPGSHTFDRLLPFVMQWANAKRLHPILRAAELHYNLAAIHPFIDGNGRTARLLSTYLLLRLGYPYLIIDVVRRGEYLAALDEANAGRLEPFARFIASSGEASFKQFLNEE